MNLNRTLIGSILMGFDKPSIDLEKDNIATLRIILAVKLEKACIIQREAVMILFESAVKEADNVSK